VVTDEEKAQIERLLYILSHGGLAQLSLPWKGKS
jgi:hypothetical protein